MIYLVVLALLTRYIHTTYYMRCDMPFKKDSKAFLWSIDGDISKSKLHIFYYAFPLKTGINQKLNVVDFKEFTLIEAKRDIELTSDNKLMKDTASTPGNEKYLAKLKANGSTYIEVEILLGDKGAGSLKTVISDNKDPKALKPKLDCKLTLDNTELDGLLKRHKEYRASLYVCLSISIAITLVSIVALIIITLKEARNK
eukprot:GAHX01000836.1.p1 GENE.GAHX01000836.1~~GAHX01000836.1.p1  ORF type:complete len:199 (-),score=30.13 GAHX01000836.1:461-1057(-)